MSEYPESLTEQALMEDVPDYQHPEDEHDLLMLFEQYDEITGT